MLCLHRIRLRCALEVIDSSDCSDDSEEMRNAALDVPRSMVTSIIVNGTMGFVWLITLLYVAPDLNILLTYPVPFIGIIINAINNIGGTIFIDLVIIYSAITATIGLISSASRTLWAFARDKGIPFNNFFCKITTRDKVPGNAVVISTFIAMLIGVIYFGNTTAFNAILSVATTSMYFTYLVPIALMLYSRKNHVSLGPWNLGKFGIVLNIIAVLFTFFFFILLNFPPVQTLMTLANQVLSRHRPEHELFMLDAWWSYSVCDRVLYRSWEESLSRTCSRHCWTGTLRANV